MAEEALVVPGEGLEGHELGTAQAALAWRDKQVRAVSCLSLWHTNTLGHTIYRYHLNSVEVDWL